MNIKELLLKNKNKALTFTCENTSQDLALNTAAAALSNGTKIIHFYTKTMCDSKNIELGFKLRQLCSMYDALLIINSRIDIAQILDADGVCLFDGDITINHAKKLIHDDKIISIYTTNLENALEAIKNKVDYICADLNNKPLLENHLNALGDTKIIELDRIIL